MLLHMFLCNDSGLYFSAWTCLSRGRLKKTLRLYK